MKLPRAVLLGAMIAGLVGARAARADDPPSCAPAAVDPSPGPLAVELGDGETWTHSLRPTASSQFPAVSEDGKTIVELFHDEVDFVGTPVATVAFFTRSGRVASFQLESDFADATHPTSPAQARLEADVVAKINARLGRTRWRALPVATECPHDEGARRSVLELGDGLTIAYDLDHGRLTSELAPTAPGRAPRTHRLRGRFPSPGQVMERDLPPGGCGTVTGLARGFGSRALGFAVLEPIASLGGDSCFGALGVDLAIVVRVP